MNNVKMISLWEDHLLRAVNLAQSRKIKSIPTVIVPLEVDELTEKLEVPVNSYLRAINDANAFGKIHIPGDHSREPLLIRLSDEASIPNILDSIEEINPFGNCYKGVCVFDVREVSPGSFSENFGELYSFVKAQREYFTAIFVAAPDRISAYRDILLKHINTVAIGLDSTVKVTASGGQKKLSVVKPRKYNEEFISDFERERVNRAEDYCKAEGLIAMTVEDILRPEGKSNHDSIRRIGF